MQVKLQFVHLYGQHIFGHGKFFWTPINREKHVNPAPGGNSVTKRLQGYLC